MPIAMQPILLTAATTLNRKSHAGTPLVWNQAAGAALTLPASTGRGDTYEVIVGVKITSVGLKIQVANATDVIQGPAFGVDDDGAPANGWAAATTSDTINMDGSTQGGDIGDSVILTDYKAGFWRAQIRLTQTGTEATPYSAAVS